MESSSSITRTVGCSAIAGMVPSGPRVDGASAPAVWRPPPRAPARRSARPRRSDTLLGALYLIGLGPPLVALLLVLVSVRTPPILAGGGFAVPPQFDGEQALTDATTLARLVPDRSPGSPTAGTATQTVSRWLARASGVRVQTDRFTGRRPRRPRRARSTSSRSCPGSPTTPSCCWPTATTAHPGREPTTTPPGRRCWCSSRARSRRSTAPRRSCSPPWTAAPSASSARSGWRSTCRPACGRSRRSPSTASGWPASRCRSSSRATTAGGRRRACRARRSRRWRRAASRPSRPRSARRCWSSCSRRRPRARRRRSSTAASRRSRSATGATPPGRRGSRASSWSRSGSRWTRSCSGSTRRRRPPGRSTPT